MCVYQQWSPLNRSSFIHIHLYHRWHSLNGHASYPGGDFRYKWFGPSLEPKTYDTIVGSSWWASTLDQEQHTSERYTIYSCNIRCVKNVTKQTRKSFKHDLPMKAKKRSELVHSNVCEPFEVRSNWGNCYFLTFIYEFTRHIWIYLIERKSEVLTQLKRFKLHVENKVSATLRNW